MSRRKKKALLQGLRARSPSQGSPAWLSTSAVLVGLAVVVLALGALIVLRPPHHSHGPADARPFGADGPVASPSGGSLAAQSPATRGELPPLPDVPHSVARSPEGIRAAYEFAARHPEVLSYVPCFCGCERKGHRSNHDCFIASRSAEGRVAWSPHGMT